MKEKLPLLLVAAILASLTNQANAAPTKKTMIPAPPPTAYAVMPPPAKPLAAKPVEGPTAVQVTTPATHVSVKSAAQRWVDSVNLKPNQSKMQLTLSIANGADNRPAYSWFRMKLNGELILTEKSLKGKRSADIDVSGLFPAGDNQLVIDGAGVPGAALTWSLTTPPVSITAIEPKQASPGGTVILKGKNFSSDVNQVNVVVGDSVADVVAATPTQLKVRIPDTAHGDTNLALSINGFPTVTTAIKVSGFPPPQVRGTNLWSAPPGTKLQIRGKWFSDNASANQVFFNNVAAQVTSASKDALEVVIPAIGSGKEEVNVPLFVISNGVKSADSVSFTIGKKATDKDYAPTVRFPEEFTQSSSQASTMTHSEANTASSRQSSASPESQAMNSPYSESGGFAIYHPGD